MDSPGENEVRLTLRMPRALYERLEKLARGDKNRRPSKINPTIVWLLERALDAAEKEPGNWIPARKAA